MFVVMLCLMAVIAVFANSLGSAGTARQQLRSIENRQQAEWLAEAGAARASARLAKELAYHGETWTIPAAELESGDPATVEIRVSLDEKRPAARKIEVTADFPAALPNRTRVTKNWVVDIRQSGSNDSSTSKHETLDGQVRGD